GSAITTGGGGGGAAVTPTIRPPATARPTNRATNASIPTTTTRPPTPGGSWCWIGPAPWTVPQCAHVVVPATTGGSGAPQRRQISASGIRTSRRHRRPGRRSPGTRARPGDRAYRSLSVGIGAFDGPAAVVLRPRGPVPGTPRRP